MSNSLLKSMIPCILIASTSIWISCKDEQRNVVPDEEPTRITITIKDENGETVQGSRIYLFDENTATDADAAIQSLVSNAEGVAVFVLNSPAADILYFKVWETLISLDNRLLGSTSLTLSDAKSYELEMTLEQAFLNYPFGYIPTTITSELARSEYERWKRTELRTCGDAIRVISDPSTNTLVEAIGFGTIVSAYANDQETFDGLMRFYNQKRTEQANMMMAWSVTCTDINDPGSATDGDLDVAFANLVAYAQWGGDYLDDAREILSVLENTVIVDCTVSGTAVKVLSPGYSNGNWGGCQLMDIMYYTPAFFRLFAEASGNDVWNQLAEDTYILRDASAHETTGLVPDWQTASGSPGPSGRVGYFGYDACRVPWRQSLDYLWNGNLQAFDWCKKVSDWSNSVGPTNITDGYELDGTARGENGLNSAFLGGFAVAAMTQNQNRANSFATAMSDLNDTYWFNLNTRIVYLFALTGNFWKPEL